MTYLVKLKNPKAANLLVLLAEMKLISILNISDDSFLNILKQLRKTAASNPPSLAEITKEVRIVRAKRYANKNKGEGYY